MIFYREKCPDLFWLSALRCGTVWDCLVSDRGVLILQVTAYQVIQSSGATGKMPTQVQFKLSNPSDQAVSPCTSTETVLPEAEA